ncbi:hypothetical protein AAHZ94_35235, partial [Streptomyces sp. HSW2009]
ATPSAPPSAGPAPAAPPGQQPGQQPAPAGEPPWWSPSRARQALSGQYYMLLFWGMVALLTGLVVTIIVVAAV